MATTISIACEGSVRKCRIINKNMTIREFVERAGACFHQSDYWSDGIMVVHNEWNLFRIQPDGGKTMLCEQNSGTNLYLNDYEIKEGDSFLLERRWGRKFMRDDLFWVCIEYNGQMKKIEICGGDKVELRELLEQIKERDIFPMSYTDDSGMYINYSLVRRKRGKLIPLKDYFSLKYNKIKCGDSLILLPSLAIMTKSIASEYRKKSLPTPNGYGYYYKDGETIHGPYTASELRDLRLDQFGTLVTNTPQYEDWLPLYLYNIETDAFLEANKGVAPPEISMQELMSNEEFTQN